MRRVLLALAFATIVVAQESTKKPARGTAAKEALLSSGVVGSFVHESVTLARDVTVFTIWSFLSVGWDVVPPAQQKLVQDQWTQFTTAAETFRVQQGIMKPKELMELGWAHYTSSGKPLIVKAFDVATKIVDKPFAIVKSFITEFEGAYPEHGGLLSGASFWDFLLTAAFLVYFVLGYSKQAFCYFVCCGFCKKRSTKNVAPVLRKGTAPMKPNGVSKKR